MLMMQWLLMLFNLPIAIFSDNKIMRSCCSFIVGFNLAIILTVEFVPPWILHEMIMNFKEKSIKVYIDESEKVKQRI